MLEGRQELILLRGSKGLKGLNVLEKVFQKLGLGSMIASNLTQPLKGVVS